MRHRPAGPLGRRPRGLRALGPARSRSSGRSPTTATSRSSSGGAELARVPAAALTSDAIVHERLGQRRRPTAGRAPAPGAPLDPSDRLPERGMDPGAVLLALLGSPNLAVAPGRLRAVRLDRRGGHGRRAGPRRGRPAGQGHDQGPRRHDRRQPGGRRARPVARRGAERRRGDPQRLDHRRPAAGRHELPQLRRPDPARGVLAAPGGRPRPRRRLPRARPAGHRRQRLALQRVTGRRHRPDRRDRRRRAARRRRPRSSARPSPRRSTRSCSSARPRPGWPARPTPGSPGVAVEDGPPALDLAREAALQAFVREAIARGLVAQRPGRVRRRARRRPRRGRDLGRPRRRRPPAGRQLAGRRAVRREPVAPRRRPPGRGSRRRSSCSPASTACRSRSSASVGGDRLVIELAGAGATGAAEERGEPRRRRARRPASPTSATPGSTACRARSAGRASPDVRRVRGGPARRRADRGRRDRHARPVRAPAPRPGVGRGRGQRRRAADALQGPRDDPHGPRRAAPAQPPRQPGHRPLPLLDDRLDDLGERPADVPAGPAASDRDRPQRQPRQHPRAARPSCRAAARACPPRPTRSCSRRSSPTSRPTDTVEALRQVLPRVRGAFSLVVLDQQRVIGVRDPHGFRPLVLGRLPAGRRPPSAARTTACSAPDGEPGWCLSSETASLDIVGAEYVRDVEPGEIVVLEPGRPPRSVRFAEANPTLCVFELIYFARPDSYMEGRNLYEVRRRMGEQLALEHPVDADLVMPVPDTGAPAAAGYAEASGLPYREGMYRNRYAGRTFIQPSQGMRHRGVTIKLNPLREVVAGKRLIVVDDSIVRGTTTKQIVELLRKAGATRGPRPDQRAADLPPVLLRHRHLDRDRAHRLDPHRGRDPRVHRRRLARLPVDPRRARRARPAVRAVLLRLLRRQLPGARAVRRGAPQVHARGAGGRRAADGRAR